MSISIDIPPGPQEGDSVSKIEISPNGTYLVAAICNDHKIKKIVGRNVRVGVDIDIEESKDVELHDKTHICVSDDKILAYIDYHSDEFSKYN